MLFAVQVKTFKPQLVAVRNESLLDELKEALAGVEQKPEIIPGEQGVIEVVYHLCPLVSSQIMKDIHIVKLIFLILRLPAT